MFKCQECGRKFKTVSAARKASLNGCPKCGGCDIDVDVNIESGRQIAKRIGSSGMPAATSANCNASTGA